MMRLYLIAVDTPKPLRWPLHTAIATDAAMEVVDFEAAMAWDGGNLRAVLEGLETILAPAAPARPRVRTSSEMAESPDDGFLPPFGYTPDDWRGG